MAEIYALARCRLDKDTAEDRDTYVTTCGKLAGLPFHQLARGRELKRRLLIVAN